jgi:hypothetical protein
MWICMSPCYAWSRWPSFWNLLAFWVSPEGQTTANSSISICRPTQAGSHINIKHIRSFTTSQAVYVWLHVSLLCDFLVSSDKLLEVFSYIWNTSLGANHSIVQYLRLQQTHSSGLTYKYQTHMVFHNLHMLWIWICMSSYHIMPDLVTHAFGS